MKKKLVQWLRYAATFLVSVAVGVGGSYVWNWAANPVSVPAAAPGPDASQTQADELQVRVRGGVAEWFDGMRWNTAGAVEELEQNDPTTVQSETWQLLAQQRSAAKQEQRQSALTQLSREENALSTGKKPAAQTTQTNRPATSTTTPTTTPAATTPGSTQAPPQTQTPPSTPSTPPAQTTTPEPVSSGDGTDMDGGGDFWG